MRDYHDTEWGVPTRDDRDLFELLILEGAQAGLSWSTVLQRREGYRRVFAGLDPVRVAAMGPDEQAAALLDPGIIRNRAKVTATVGNATAWLELAAEHGSFSEWLWAHVDGRPVVNRWARPDQVPTESPLSIAISTALRRRGFRFVGPTIIYAYLQATGVVMDHLTGCYRHQQLAG